MMDALVMLLGVGALVGLAMFVLWTVVGVAMTVAAMIGRIGRIGRKW